MWPSIQIMFMWIYEFAWSSHVHITYGVHNGVRFRSISSDRMICHVFSRCVGLIVCCLCCSIAFITIYIIYLVSAYVISIQPYFVQKHFHTAFIHDKHSSGWVSLLFCSVFLFLLLLWGLFHAWYHKYHSPHVSMLAILWNCSIWIKVQIINSRIERNKTMHSTA